MVRVRIAPSPTGIPHIGNTRTALFNYLFARHNKGTFILRIEDTDRTRIVDGAKEAIIEILDWLGFVPDETYIQSERLALYKEASQVLLRQKNARIDNGAVRFTVPKGRVLRWIDAIGNKTISFKSEDVEDFIILKSDGFPTYHLANVVDDHDMKITHVIRGDEWISSTPKHLLLYESFGWTHPVFAHLPVILGPDKTKLSKRHGAKPVLDYRNEGYLKVALINFMAFLGWMPKVDKEILSISEMIKLFDLKDVNTNSPIFDIKKLEWMNGIYIRELTPQNLKYRIAQFLGNEYPIGMIEKTVPIIQSRIKKLSDYLPLCEFFFRAPKTYELDLSEAKKVLKATYKSLQVIDWRTNYIGNCLQTVSENLKMRIGEISMLLRVAITGKKISPPLNESMEILGKEKVLERLEAAQNL